MRILVCGGRDFNDYHKVYETLHELVDAGDVIIQGGASGADACARRFALSVPLECKTYPADWSRYKNAAGPIRNREMLKHGKPDVVIAFAGGRGTADMVTKARAAGVKVIEIA